MLLDNTQFMGRGVGVRTPNTQLYRAGYSRAALSGLGDVLPADPSQPAGTTVDMSTAMTAINSEATYLLNLARVQAGLQPLPTNLAAPTVNFGLSQDTMLLLAALGIGFAVFHKKRRR